MGRDAVQDALLAAGLVDQPEAALSQVTQAAVQESTRAAAGSEGQIVLLDQSHPQSSHGGIAGHARSDNSPADNQDVQGVSRQPIHRGGTALHNKRRRMEFGTVHFACRLPCIVHLWSSFFAQPLECSTASCHRAYSLSRSAAGMMG